MSTTGGTVPESINHVEARQRATSIQAESNLARCYIQVCEQSDRYREVLEKIGNCAQRELCSECADLLDSILNL